MEAERRVGSRLALVAVPTLVGATSSGQQACHSRDRDGPGRLPGT
ncbi:MAG TPA: hypothetical protein VIZ60_01115 [Rubrobacter sp.]